MCLKSNKFFSVIAESAILAASLVVAGCVGSEVVTIDDMRFRVAKRDATHYDAWFTNVIMVNPKVLEIKEKEIRAVESVSGCKVVESEFVPTTFVLNTRVECREPKRGDTPANR